MNNPNGKLQSDIDCQKCVDYYNNKGIESSISSEDEDKTRKYDMLIGGVKFDLKRFNDFYCEIDKLQNSSNEAERIMMIVNEDLKHVYSIKKDALIRTCAEYIKPLYLLEIDEIPQMNSNRNKNVRYKIGKMSGDKLAYFSLDMLKKDDYKIVDLSKVLV